jgi:hypothetical protein
MQASANGVAASMGRNCRCCGKSIEREIPSTCCELKRLSYLGVAYPIFFKLYKYVIQLSMVVLGV